MQISHTELGLYGFVDTRSVLCVHDFPYLQYVQIQVQNPNVFRVDAPNFSTICHVLLHERNF